MSGIIAAILGPSVTLLLAWLIGNALTTRWDAVKKKSEMNLNALEKLYQLYGEFFEVWKVWDTSKGQEPSSKDFHKTRAELLERAAKAEGIMESLLVRITSERVLSDRELDLLGAFRQSYQTLREAIENDINIKKDLGWKESHAIPYAAFKGLASSVAAILAQPAPMPFLPWQKIAAPSRQQALQSLRQVTSNAYESWRFGREKLVVWQAVAYRAGLLDFKEDLPNKDESSRYYDSRALYEIPADRT
jgi:hypothetical protein